MPLYSLKVETTIITQVSLGRVCLHGLFSVLGVGSNPVCTNFLGFQLNGPCRCKPGTNLQTNNDFVKNISNFVSYSQMVPPLESDSGGIYRVHMVWFYDVYKDFLPQTMQI